MQQLQRQLHLPGAIVIGLGSILGTGVFVSLAYAAGIVQNAAGLLLACLIGGCVAALNGLSSAQLAAAHPVAGGTYEYGYRFLNPLAGFTAGATFLFAKTASAAAAALSAATYLVYSLELQVSPTPIAAGVVILFTAFTLLGLKRTNALNAIIVACTILGLGAFIYAAAQHQPVGTPVKPDLPLSLPNLLYAAAIVFVAYTGYGRIATMGEEVVEPRRTIPRAVIITLLVALVLYLAVAWAATRAVGAAGFGQFTGQRISPLTALLDDIAAPRLLFHLTAIAAITAMLGVLLNLILGLSRVLLALGRRKDGPSALATLNAARTTPTVAVIVIGIAILGVVLISKTKAAWEFSALTVLIYYALTNLAAIRVPKDQRFLPRVVPVLGLVSCLGLTVFIPWRTWLLALGLLAVALLYRVVWKRVSGS